jgi:hypothetical protein
MFKSSSALPRLLGGSISLTIPSSSKALGFTILTKDTGLSYQVGMRWKAIVNAKLADNPELLLYGIVYFFSL